MRRGRLYHVHHKPLYEAISQADNRNRRVRTLGRMVERVMILDAVLGDRRCWWLSPEADKRRFFGLKRESWLQPEDYPHIAFGSGRQRTIRCFPDKVPIGIEKDHTDHVVFLYLVNRRLPVDFRQFLIRHAELFRFPTHMDGPVARATTLQEGRRPVQSRATRRAVDTAEPKRHQSAGDVLPRAAGTGGTPRRSGRSRHQGRVPHAGDAEDPSPVSGLATTGRPGSLAGSLDLLA